MKRSMLSIVIALLLSGYVSAQDSGIANWRQLLTHHADEPPTYPVSIPVRNLNGRYGFFFQSGFLKANNLCIEDASSSEKGAGIPLGAGLYYFIGKDVALGIDLAYIPLSKWFHLWGEYRSWSMLEFGTHLKYINSPSSKVSFYQKLALKMVRLSGSVSPGQGLFGGTVGSYIRTRTSFAPGGELAIGLTTKPSREAAFFIEVTIGQIWMREKNVRANSEEALKTYPLNLNLLCVRIGIQSHIGGK